MSEIEVDDLVQTKPIGPWSSRSDLGIAEKCSGVTHGSFAFSRQKSYSVVAMNLETVEDVNRVIDQCEAIKQEFAVQERKLKVMEVPDCKEKEV